MAKDKKEDPFLGIVILATKRQERSAAYDLVCG